MLDLVGEAIRGVPYYGLMTARVGGVDCIVSQTGFSGEKGYEIYAFDSTLYAENLWYAILEAGEKHNLMVTAPPHQRRVQAGILSYGQDMDHESNPFQCNLGHMVPKKKKADYIGKAALERIRDLVQQGRPPFEHMLVGLKLGGKPIDDHPPDFWLISGQEGDDPVGWITSPWYSPELEVNVAMGYVPVDQSAVGTELNAWLPEQYQTESGRAVRATVVDLPFRPSVYPSSREQARAKGRDYAY